MGSFKESCIFARRNLNMHDNKTRLNMKKVLWILVILVTVFVVALIGGSFYTLNFSLAPDPNRMDTDSCYRQ